MLGRRPAFARRLAAAQGDGPAPYAVQGWWMREVPWACHGLPARPEAGEVRGRPRALPGTTTLNTQGAPRLHYPQALTYLTHLSIAVLAVHPPQCVGDLAQRHVGRRGGEDGGD